MAYPFRAILGPIQFDEPALLGLGFAKRIAQDSGVTLHLLHVVPMVPAIGEPAVSAAIHSPCVRHLARADAHADGSAEGRSSQDGAA
jgi:nucleotide-binding universal stress UspA family protein